MSTTLFQGARTPKRDDYMYTHFFKKHLRKMRSKGKANEDKSHRQVGSIRLILGGAIKGWTDTVVTLWLLSSKRTVDF